MRYKNYIYFLERFLKFSEALVWYSRKLENFVADCPNWQISIVTTPG